MNLDRLKGMTGPELAKLFQVKEVRLHTPFYEMMIGLEVPQRGSLRTWGYALGNYTKWALEEDDSAQTIEFNRLVLVTLDNSIVNPGDLTWDRLGLLYRLTGYRALEDQRVADYNKLVLPQLD